MPKVTITSTKIRVSIGKWRALFKQEPEEFQEFKYKEIGRPGHTRLVIVKLESGNWVRYVMEFDKRDVSWDQRKRTLTATDPTAYEVLKDLKDRGDLETVIIKRGSR